MTYTILIILHQAFNPKNGGVQRSTFKISSFLKSNGHNTHVFSYQINGHTEQEVAVLHHARQNNLFKNKNNNNQLQSLISTIKPDIVINQKPYAFEIGDTLLRAKKNHHFLMITCLRNTLFTVKLNLDSYLKGIVSKRFQPIFNNKLGKKILLMLHKTKHTIKLKQILDMYDYFVMFGPSNIEELKYFVGNYKLNKTYLIPNSILSVQTYVPIKEKRILWLSRMSYNQKRADLIIPLWKKIMHLLPDWEFDLVGYGDAYNDIKMQIKDEQLPRIKLYGSQQPDDFYKRSPIYIMTSENEGFPNTLIEAQSYGAIPIVYNSYPICSWLLKNGERGILIPPFDVDKMANEIVSLAKDKQRQEKLMVKMLENAREFEINKVGLKWINFFDNALKKNIKK